MKKIAIITILLLSILEGYTQARQRYRIRIDDLKLRVTRNVKNRTSSNVHVRIRFSDGSEESVYDRQIRDDYNEPGFNYNVVRDKQPIGIRITGFINYSSTGDAEFAAYLPITNGCLRNGFHIYRHSGLNPSFQFNYSSKPLIYIDQPTNTTVGYDDPFRVAINFNNSPRFSSSLYNWEYQIVETGTPRRRNWLSVPNVGIVVNQQGRRVISVQPSRFLGPDVIGKRIYFRVRTCGITTRRRNPNTSENVVFYDIIPSAPHILSRTPSNPKCYDGNDGTVRLRLDRQLENGEQLSITSTNGNFPGTYVNLTRADFDPDNSILITGLKAGSYKIDLFGFYRGFNTFIGGSQHYTNVTLYNPNPIEFSVDKTDVFCYNGNDGEVRITANGGRSGRFQYVFKNVNDTSPIQESDWQNFTNTGSWPSYQATQTIGNLIEGKYKVRIRDINGCEAKDVIRNSSGAIVGLGAISEKEIEVKQPDKALKVDFTFKKEPTGFGFSDGQIVAHITGGTPLSGNRYNYTWTHEKNGIVTNWTNFTEETVAGEEGWFVTLQNGIDGNYSLTVTDANHSAATNKNGCTVINATNKLTEPEQLTVTIRRTNPISCNPSNTFGNTADDGELEAIAMGGIKFNPLIDGKYEYEYTWKKKDASGNYQIITGENGNILSNREEGEYAVNIKDKNGVIVGTYINNVLDTAQDATFNLTPPDLLTISYTKQDVFCHNGTDGAIDVTINGGTGNYTIKWSNNKDVEDIDNLTAGSYTITVTDEKGCQAQETIQIEQPDNPLKIDYQFFEPTFAGATNGWIEATVTGGTPLDSGEYTFIWKDSSGNDLQASVTSTVTSAGYVLRLTGLGEGIYNLTIQDKNYPLAIDKPNCTIIESTYALDDPEPLQAFIRINNPISCNGSNIYGDPFSDGELEVFASGGIKLQPTQNSGLSYFYTWKKETSPGVWTELTSQTTNIASGLGEGNYAVNIKDANGIVLGEYQNNVLVQEKDIIQEIKEPELLEVAIKLQHAYCIGGSDGWAEAVVKGGTAPYTYEWEDGRTTSFISDLAKGTYKLRVKDARDCNVDIEVLIEEPKQPISITFSEFATPSTKDASDGWIKAEIEGGTPTTSGTYTYYWQDESGNLLNAQTTAQFINNKFEIILNGIPKGNYFLTIEDANYTIATTKNGCTRLDEEFNLYDPIEATISVETTISCNQNNTFNNPFSDGALKVVVTGGLPFTTGAPYKYIWKKENSAGVYEDLGVNNAILSNISDGNYALNVEDSRGIVIGEYSSLNLISPTDELFTFEEPELLTVALTATEISCDAGNDGTATVEIFGGIPPYTIEWSNQQTTPTATGLIATNYVVFVTDARGCQATGNITLSPPGGIVIDTLVKNDPSCFKGNDGEISLQISGGVTPYTYAWGSGETTTSLSNLTAGNYIFTLKDANGCNAVVEFTLNDPEEITIDLGEDKVLCNGQSYLLNGAIEDANAKYEWTSDNGFSSDQSEVEITREGTYTITAISENGCVASDTVIVTYRDLNIDAELIMSSQAYVNEEVVIFNGSDHDPESFEWILPENTVVVEERANSIVVKFTEVKNYEIGLISKQGECSQATYKTIVIEEANQIIDEGDNPPPFIESFTISPNPNSGVFETYVKLADPSKIAIRIFNIQGELMKKREMEALLDEHQTQFNVSMSSGMYIVVLETPKQTQVKRMIVN
ncbi:T9SS type A sorting domain-containing protein [Tenacibaculum jejuense]|uniref:Secretion system C-terminal sorting domain-containing protein n=1 Tax=Tenacibaculum jejuense TaxID=584609 RepID=A0A238U685_9FLAO|nr:T9SS type A sorting domain-containing protein [Tenacibaculum jejuense]SNR14555.1 protein of unknown function [Tenacibaculum jejuense]